MAAIELSENHRRSISITLQLVDKALCEWDDWAHGKVRSGVMYRQQDALSPTQKDELQKRIANLRKIIVRLRDDLGLDPVSPSTSYSIVGQASILWEMLADPQSRVLRGYGEVPDRLSSYLDPIADELCLEVNEIARFFSRATP